MMEDFLSRLFSHRRTPGHVETAGPQIFHWLDTTPVESTDASCTLEDLDVTVRVSGLYAQVTEKLVLKNPNPRDLSVSVTIPLPDRAIICGYSLEIHGHMRDGVVVEKERARVAFETEQRRGVDPGLAEAVRGNTYNTRVYPVPARGTRAIQIRYVAPLLLAGDGSATLDLPMPTERLAHRHVHIDVEALDCPRPNISGLGNALLQEARGYWSVSIEEYDTAPSESIRVAMPQLPASFVLLERDDEGTVWFSASTSQKEEPEPAVITSLTVLWDASGSRDTLDHARELDLLSSYASSKTIESLHLVTFCDQVREVREFDSAQELFDCVRALRYDGGTNLVELSRKVAELPFACAGIGNGSACLLFTDGLDTLAGETFTMPATCDVMAIVSGMQRDVEALRQACKGHAFDLATAPQDAEALARSFGHMRARRTLEIHGAGIADVCDVGAMGGNRHAVVGRLTAEQATLTLGGAREPLLLCAEDAREGSVLACAWAARRVSLLSTHADDNAEELLRLGRRFGVASPVTSLLVLETVDQWIRYDIEPPKSWTSMHREWVRAKKGFMRHFPLQANKWQHRDVLARSWKSLLAWWEKDFRARPIPHDGTPLCCPKCGWPVHNDETFCISCGALVKSEDRPEPRFASPGRTMFHDATPTMAVTSSGSMAREDSFAMPQMARLSVSAAASASVPDALPAAANMLFDEEEALGDYMPDSGASANESSGAERDGGPRVNVRPWMPDAPYLKKLDDAYDEGIENARKAYFEQRHEFRPSPSFYLDCSGWFVAHDDMEFGLRVLCNLAELRIDDAALLRVMGWRLREAGRLEQALVILKRVRALRNEDSQGHRDVAQVLDELARKAFAQGDEDSARAYAQEAGEVYRKVALTPWQRHPIDVALFAVEEYNVFRAWAEAQTWEAAPDLPSLGEDLEGVPDCDLRITLAWDADETDVDIHVTEPSGEEAYYAHNRTSSGGRVSRDITDGYGPELYEIRRAQKGPYIIRAHYYASHQQTIFGPATCTLTVYTDWGRPGQRQQVTSTRLGSRREMVDVGTAAYIQSSSDEKDETTRHGEVKLGMTPEQVTATLGEPDEREESADSATWTWNRNGGHQFVVVFSQGVVTRLLERMPWGDEMIVAQ